jgi:hypothetical protein
MKEYTLITEKLNKMIKNNEIQSFKFKYDEETNVMEIYITPVKILEHVTINLTLTPKSVEFINY